MGRSLLDIDRRPATAPTTAPPRKPPGRAYRVPGSLPEIAAASPAGAWAAMVTMLMSWRDGRSMSIDDALAQIGPEWADLYRGGGGVPSNRRDALLAAAGLVAETPRALRPGDWEPLLREHGPIWMTRCCKPGGVFSRRAALVVGASGSKLELIDPVAGRRRRVSVDDLKRRFARRNDGGAPRLELIHATRAPATAAPVPANSPPVAQSLFARPFAAVNFDVPGAFQHLQQTNTMLCWATTASMMLAWRDQTNYGHRTSAERAGATYTAMFDGNQVLGKGQVGGFANALGMSVRAQTSWSPETMAQFMADHGPLWVFGDQDMVNNFLLHARIITGIHGDGTGAGTMLTISDPLQPGPIQESFDRLMQRMSAPDANWYESSVVHWPARPAVSHSLATRYTTAFATDLTEYHGFVDSVRWRLVADGVDIEGSGVERTAGAPATITRIWEAHAADINSAATEFNVPCAHILATIATESGGNANAVRQEPGFVSDAATPNKVSPGLMQTLISTARTALPADAPNIDRAWLLVPLNSIRAGTAYIASQKPSTELDPPRVACAYNAGSLCHQPGAANRWKMRQYPIGTGEHCDRFVKWFNDAVHVLDGHATQPTVGYGTMLPAPPPRPGGGMPLTQSLPARSAPPARAFTGPIVHGVENGWMMDPFYRDRDEGRARKGREPGRAQHLGIDVSHAQGDRSYADPRRGLPVYCTVRGSIPIAELNAAAVISGNNPGTPQTGLGLTAASPDATLRDGYVIHQPWDEPGNSYGAVLALACHYDYTTPAGTTDTFTLYVEWLHLIDPSHPPKNAAGAPQPFDEYRQSGRGWGFGPDMPHHATLAAAQITQNPPLLVGYLGATETPHVHIQVAYAPRSQNHSPPRPFTRIDPPVIVG